MILLGLIIGIAFGFLGGVIISAIFLFLTKKYETIVEKFIETGKLTKEKGSIFNPPTQVEEFLDNNKQDIEIG